MMKFCGKLNSAVHRHPKRRPRAAIRAIGETGIATMKMGDLPYKT